VDGDVPEPDSIVYESGDPGWMEEGEASEATDAEDPDSRIESITLPPSESPIRPGTLAQSASARHGHEDLGRQLRLGNDEALDKGLVIHALLEQVEWLEDFKLSDEALGSMVRRLMPRREEAWIEERIAQFRDMLELEDVKILLSRGDRDPESLQVWRELPFARIIDHRLRLGYIDRLEVELGGDGKPLRANVIDFKTDQIRPADSKDCAEKYRSQLEAYRPPAAERAGLPPEAIDLTVLLTSLGESITLNSTS
jgi:ATP-dependent exoDNAse (exonuclease V) beta subunit